MLTEELIAQLKRHEGTGPVRDGRIYVYRCTAGARTVGYGHNLDARPLNSIEAEFTGWDGHSVTEHGAEWLLAVDAARAEDDVYSALPWTYRLSQARRDALTNMCFQMGIGGLVKFKNTLRLIEGGNYRAASGAMLLSKWARQTPNRARELARQIRTGEYA